MYVQAAAAGSTQIQKAPQVSLMPEYTQLSGNILPRYSPIGETVEIPEIEIKGDPYEPERKAALMAGVLFFTGLALGYIWGGATGGISAR